MAKEKNPKLESKLNKPAKDKDSEEPKKRHRRSNAEKEQEEYDKVLGVEPKPFVAPLLTSGSNFIVDLVRVPDDVKDQLRLTETNVNDLTVPISQLMEYYLPKLPPVVYAWVGLGMAIFGIAMPRVKLVQEYVKEHNPTEKVDAKPDDPNTDNK